MEQSSIDKNTLTKIFLKHSGIAVSEANLKLYTHKWWKNTRTKKVGGLRLTHEGYDFLRDKLDLKFYQIVLPPDFRLTTQTVINLDHFIDCPYYMDDPHLFVTSEKKATELILFAGDIEKYGLTKALKQIGTNEQATDN